MNQKQWYLTLWLFGCVVALGLPARLYAQTRPASQPTSAKTPARQAVPTSRPAARPAPRVEPQRKATAPAKRRPTVRQPAPSLPKLSPKDKLYLAIVQTQELLKRILWKFGRDPDNPWLLAHTLLVFGKDMKLDSGQLAIDRIVSGYLKFKQMGGAEVPYFPAGTLRDRIEPHPSMHLKTFLELGVPLSRKFKVGKRTVTLQQMLEGVYKLFPSHPKGREMGTQAWRFFLLYGHRPNNDRAWAWVNGKGERVVFVRQVYRLMKYLDKNTSFLRILQNRGVKVIPKLRLRRQHIYGEPCGGFHLLQAAARWMGHPALKKRLTPLLNAQIDLMFYRASGEVKLYTQLFKKYQRHAGYRFIILLQQLKFLGHLLETVADLHHWGLLHPTKEQRKAIRHAVRLTVVTVMLLYRLGWYERLPTLKQRSYQLYLDLLGDSAHATHALMMIHNTGLYTP